MQPSMEHFTELRQLLHTGHYENDARQPVNPRSTRARPAQQPDTLVFSAQQQSAARPPIARSGVAAATRSRRPPPAPVAPSFLSQGNGRAPTSRPAATRNDVDLYLAQLNHQQPPMQHHYSTQQHTSTAAATSEAHAAQVQQPAPEQHRRAKRGKPMARRSLQALFDLAAEDSSTWQTSASTAGDVEDDGDTGIFASATSGESSLLLNKNNSNNGMNPSSLVSSFSDAALLGMPGPSTPANCDSGLLGEAGTGKTITPTASRPESPADAAGSGGGGGNNNTIQDNLSSLVPLRHLLMSERGRRLTSLEAKAIILRVAEDLAALHAANSVHRRVSIESISLTTCPYNDTSNTTAAAAAAAGEAAGEIAVAILPPGRSAAVLGSNRCYWALKDSAFDAHHAPPEVACCPVDRPVAFTPAGDMWGLGIVLFTLLSAGLPFCAPSCVGFSERCEKDENGADEDDVMMTSTVDSLQRQLYKSLHCQIDVINQLSAAQAAGAAGGASGSGSSNVPDNLLEMMAIGFDSQATKLLLGLLHADPAQRFSAVDVLKHPWVAEAIPFVPKMPSSSLPLASKTGTAANGPARESTPPMSDVLRRTEQLGFTPSSQPTDNHHHHHQSGAGLNTTSAAPLAAAVAAECPYPIIGHVAQPLEVLVGGRKVTISALHAVYDVPGYGAMMSAAPLAVADPAEVSAAAAAAAAPAAAGDGRHFLNLLGNSS